MYVVIIITTNFQGEGIKFGSCYNQNSCIEGGFGEKYDIESYRCITYYITCLKPFLLQESNQQKRVL